MANDNWSVDSTSTVIASADTHRAEVTVQWYSGDAVYLGVDEEPVVGKGIKLFSGNTIGVFRGDDAMKEIKGICDTVESAAGGVRLK